MAHLTPRESAAVLDELGSMKPSVSSLDRLPKQLSGRWEEQREAFEEALRASRRSAGWRRRRWRCRTDARRAAASQAGARAAGRATKGPAGYRDVANTGT